MGGLYFFSAQGLVKEGRTLGVGWGIHLRATRIGLMQPLLRAFRMDIHRIQRSVFYRYQHVTGPKCVLVSLRFGKTPPSGPALYFLVGVHQAHTPPQFDLANHVTEVLAGVELANAEMGTRLEVEAIEVVPSDYPGKGQAQYVAYQIAIAIAKGEVQP